MVSLDGSHLVFIQALHPLWNVDFIIVRVVKVICKVMEKWLKVIVLVACTRPGVCYVILRWSEFWHNVDHIVEPKHTHVTIVTHGILNDLKLHLKHWN